MQLPHLRSVLSMPFSKQEVKQSPDRVVMEMLGEDQINLRRNEGVVAMARGVAMSIPKNTGNLLILAAHYHNIGMSKFLSGEINFAPLRGAMWTQDMGLPSSVTRAIFEQSGSRLLSKLCPGAAECYLANPEKPSSLSMYLSYCDLRISSAGEIVSMPVRFQEMMGKHEAGSAHCKVMEALWNYFESVVEAVEHRLPSEIRAF